MEEIANDIYIEDSLPGVTIGAIIQRQGTLMIDAPLRAENARSWKAKLLHLGGGIHRLLVNLDGHHDRTLGNRAIGCNTIAHVETLKYFENQPATFKGQNEDSGSEWENLLEMLGTRWMAPNLLLTDNISIHWGGPEIKIEHHPGPEPGALWVIVPEEKVVFVGDAVVLNQPPFLARADIPQWIQTLRLLRKVKYRNYTIICGRGGRATVQDVKNFQQYLKGILGRIERLSARHGRPEQTGRFVKSLLKKNDFPIEFSVFYGHRLHYGLYRYYSKHYYSQTKPTPE